MKRTLVLVLVGVMLAGCSSDPTTSDEYIALEGEREALTLQLATLQERSEALSTQVAELQTERNALSVELETFDSMAIAETNEDAYLEAFFAKDLDAIMATFTNDPVFEDRTFGDYLVGAPAVRTMERAVFRITDVEASEVLGRAIASDGSLSVSLWRWTGTNAFGGAFDIPTVVVHEYEDGKIAKEMLYYAARDAYEQLFKADS